MFQDTSSSNSLNIAANGAYKFANLACSIDSSIVTNSQDYGFSIDTPASLIRVSSDQFSIGWAVLNPNTNRTADLSDGIFSYFTVDLLDKNNKVISTLDSSLRDSTYLINVSGLFNLSKTLYGGENYLRDCRILLTSYNISGQTAKAVFILNFLIPSFTNVDVNLNNKIVCSYSLSNVQYAKNIILEKSKTNSFEYIDEQIFSSIGSSVFYDPKNYYDKNYYRLSVVDYYNTGSSYLIGQIKPNTLDLLNYDYKPQNITGGIIVNYDSIAQNYERYFLLKWAINSSNIPLDYEIHISASGSTGSNGIHRIYNYSTPVVENINFIGFETGVDAFVNSTSGINPYYSGSGYVPVFSVADNGSGIKWQKHTIYTDSKGSFPSGVYTGNVSDLLYNINFDTGSINSDKLFLNYYFDTGSGSFRFYPSGGILSGMYDSGYYSGFSTGNESGLSYLKNYTGILVAEKINLNYPTGSIVLAGPEPRFYIPIFYSTDYEIKVRGIVSSNSYTDFSDIIYIPKSGIDYATTGVHDPGSGAVPESLYFTGDLIVSIASGKTFGKYLNGDTIPASGKTPKDVIEMALRENLDVTTSLTSSTSIAFNQTAISNILNFSYSVNTLGASVSGASLEYRRGNVGSWSVLASGTATPDSFTHSLTDTNYNTSGFYYRYVVTDTAGSSGVSLLTIAPSAYSAPTASLSILGNNLIGPETNSKREKGHINSTLGGTVTRNSTNVNLTSYQWQYQLDGAGSWVDIASPVSIGPGTTSITSTGHNDSSLKAAASLSYRIKIIDAYQSYLSSQVYSSSSTVDFFDFIFYGPTSSTPANSADVRSLSSKIFTDGSNPFNLNTSTTQKIFSVAMPSSLSVSEVIDLDALSANITANYIQSSVSVANYTGDTSAYNVYTMTNAIPYTSNHRHQITRVSA